MTSVEPPERGHTRIRPALFYSLAFAIAWIAWTPLLLHKLAVRSLPLPFVITLFVGQTTGAFAPLLSLVVVQRVSGDPTLVQRVFGRLRFKGLPIHWYVVPPLTPIVVTVAATLWHGLVSGGTPAVLRPEPVAEIGWALLAVVPLQFVLGLIGSPLGEEPGWRGYVLDGFARNERPLAGSAVVASLWWIWHVPLFLVLGVEPTLYSFLAMASHSLLLDSLFLLSGRNLLVAMLYHQGINTSFMFFLSKAETVAGCAVFVMCGVVMRFAAHRMAARDSAPSLPSTHRNE